MTFTDKWGTTYPEEVRKFINPGRLSNIDRKVLEKGIEITSNARTTDEAILSIHSFIKGIQSKRVPAINNDPVLNATGVLDEISANPSVEMLPREKVVLEIALLRANDIPARVTMYECNARSPVMVSKRRSRSLFTAPKISFFSTEVFTTGRDGAARFVPKDSWIPESECAKHEGTCTIAEKMNWAINREIRGAIDVASCKQGKVQKDFPVAPDVLSRAGTEARKYMHVLDIIDPVEDES